jgi:hypothetical protein
MMLCKIQYSNDLTDNENSGSYKTLGPLRRVEHKDMDLFTEFLIQRLGLINDSYSPLPVDKITFTYLIKEGNITESDRLLLVEADSENNDLAFHQFNKMRLPVSMEPQDYGKIEVSNEIEEDGVIFQRYIVSNNKYTYRIDMYDGGMINIVSILGQIDMSWTDYRLDETISHFKRVIGKSTIHFLSGIVILQEKQLNAKSFRKTRSGLY